MDVTWHGHATFHLAVGDTTLLVDPYFDNPKTDVDPAEMVDPDYVLLTHGHTDHIEDVDEFPTSKVVAGPELLDFVGDHYGVEHTEGMNISGTMEAGDAYVTMLRGDHTNGYNTTYEYGGDMGATYHVSTENPSVDGGSGTSVFVGGDGGLMSEMKDFVGPYLQPTAVALPICERYAMGPMTAAVATDWMDPEYAIPMHYDTFPTIEEDPHDYADQVAATGCDADVVVLDGDETFTLD